MKICAMKIKIILITLAAMLLATALIFQSCKKEEEKPNQPPTCDITSPDNGEEITKGETVTIAVDANDSDGTISEVRFFVDNVGVGSATTFPYNYEWNTGSEDTGDHTLKATAIDNNGESTSDDISVTLLPGGIAPDADFSANPTSGTAPLTVNFTDHSTNTSTSWQWDFGDGNTSTQQNPSHTYNNPGNYTVSLTATNNYGSDTKTNNSYITVINGGGGGSTDLEWVSVTGGTFQMGSNVGYVPEQPVHTVTLNIFQISKYEVTNGQYCEFLNDIGCNSDGS